MQIAECTTPCILEIIQSRQYAPIGGCARPIKVVFVKLVGLGKIALNLHIVRKTVLAMAYALEVVIMLVNAHARRIIFLILRSVLSYTLVPPVLWSTAQVTSRGIQGKSARVEEAVQFSTTLIRVSVSEIQQRISLILAKLAQDRHSISYRA